MSTLKNKSDGKVAVICAFHHGNAGMLSVDLSAVQFLTDLHIPFDLIVGQAKDNGNSHHYGGLSFKTVRDIKYLNQYDCVLYWGDFLNNPSYGIGGFSGQDVGLGNSKTKDDGYQAWKNIMMPDKKILDNPRVISVSNNFQNIEKVMNKEAQREFSGNFSSGFDYIFPRDPLSMESLITAFPQSSHVVHQGVDAAYLWDARREFNIPKHTPGNYFSYFFGRSKFENDYELISLISQVTGLEPRPLDGWLSCRPSPREKMEGLLRQINGSAFVVSDTYHCCVNTMNLRVPIIGLGVSTTLQRGTLGDHKKQVLFNMFNMSSFYHAAQAKRLLPEEMENVLLSAIRISRDGVGNSTFDSMVAKVEIYRSSLTSAITKSLERSV